MNYIKQGNAQMVWSAKKTQKKVNNSGENKCSCEALTYVQDLIKIPSTSKELVKSIRQEKQLRKDFEMKTATRFFAMNEIIINMSQTCQSCSSKTDKDLSVEKMNSTLHGLLVNVEEIKSSIRNIQNDTRVLSSAFHSQSAIFATSSNTIRSNDAEIRRIASELEFVKGVIAYLSARG
ncbi:hypothetical protein CHS0354_008992 [Potamilus streckersoni]|uniref:Uncharacterized protein n=1 Tax=Potamilus streckersoni TaxID=2493646 RepID=A0AAE0THY4_9BIVA|nr:hypothetical protein CHS0354_008992 [Potamilus streckersoni]